MGRRVRRTPRPVPKPWAAEEDEKLTEICRLGLASDHWHRALPGRRFSEICERRLDLGLKSAMLT